MKKGGWSSPDMFDVDTPPNVMDAYKSLSIVNKYWFHGIASLMAQASAQELSSSCQDLKALHAKSQLVLQVLSTYLFGVFEDQLTDPTTPSYGDYQTSAMDLIGAIPLRFCVTGESPAAPGGCCPSPQTKLQIIANRHYAQLLLSVAFGVLDNCAWVEPIWATPCQSTSIQANTTGCGGTPPLPGNYLLQTAKGPCFVPNKYPYIALACCSPVGYSILAPLNLADVAGFATPLWPSLTISPIIPTPAFWRQLARNILITHTWNIAKAWSLPSVDQELLVNRLTDVIEALAPAFGGPGFGVVDWFGQL